MTLQEALNLETSTRIEFAKDGIRGEGEVVGVTDRGGIRVCFRNRDGSIADPVHDVWVPYHAAKIL